jgi:hypothetical protein
MMERFGNWISVSALVLAACGGVEDAGSLAKSRAALAPDAPATTPSSSPAPASSSVPSSGHGCRSDADCAAGWECESEHGRYYCAPHREDKEYHGADAGAPPEHCGEQAEDCHASACSDAGSYERHGDDCRDDDGHRGHGHGDDADDDGHDADDDYEDRSGSNSGPH